jgi:GGDEF domain-containing protein
MVEQAVLPAPASAEERDAWKQLAFLILSATRDHSAHCGLAEREAFRQRLEQAQAGLEGSSDASQILITAGTLAHAISRYGAEMQRRVDAVAHETSGAVRLFLRHLQSIHDTPECHPLLDELRSAIETGASVARLQECLDQLGQRSVSIRPPSHRSGRMQSAHHLDACTGLPVRSEAESALREAADGAVPVCAAIFYLHRMALTNARFGEAIGNQVIQACSEHVAAHAIKSTDRLYRWSGPAFLAILYRSDSLVTVGGEVQRLVCSPLSRFFETATRSVYLPMKISGEVIPVHGRPFAEIAEQIEHFVLNTSGAASCD